MCDDKKEPATEPDKVISFSQDTDRKKTNVRMLGPISKSFALRQMSNRALCSSGRVEFVHRRSPRH